MKKALNLTQHLPRLLAALLLLGAGILFLAFSDALKILGITIGALLVLFSLIYAILTLRNPTVRYRYARLCFSILGILSGTVTMILQTGALSVIVTVGGILLIVNGSFNLHKEILRYKGRDWCFWLLCTLAVLTILGGFVLIRFFPDPNSALAGYVLGTVLIIDALRNLLSPPWRLPAPTEEEPLKEIEQSTEKEEPSAIVEDEVL